MRRRFPSAWVGGLLTVLAALLAPHASASDEPALTTIVVPLASLSFDDGQPAPALAPWWTTSGRLIPRVILDGAPGEVYIGSLGSGPDARWMLAAQVPEGSPLTGVLFVPAGSRELAPRRFGADPIHSVDDAEQRFLEVKANWYRHLLALGGPGAAWFRYQLNAAQQGLGGAGASGDGGTNPRSSIEDTFSLISGGRAVSENLQLDRLLPTSVPADETVPLDSIEGVAIPAIDWGPLVEGKYPSIDPLAHFIPADQHAVFFPSFDDLRLVADEADRRGTPVVQTFEARIEDALTRERTEAQLGLSLDLLARVIGPQVVGSVAITGSDLELRVGSDVALLFESTTESLHKLILGKVQLAGKDAPDVETLSGEIHEQPYAGVRTPDRSLCSLVAALGDFVIVTNSEVQLARIIEAWKGFRPALGGLEEFRFFRDRYPRGEPETAFVMLSDATIRRWCGPRWRIAASRRTRAAAMLAQLRAEHVAREAAGAEMSAAELTLSGEFPDLGTLYADQGQLTRSETYGTVAFMTPIVELDMDAVTETEADLYFRWKTGYERNWSGVFDPIGVRLVLEPDESRLDISVRPLILGSEYNRWIETTEGVSLQPGHGDPHAGTLQHFVMALNKDARIIQSSDGINMARVLAPQVDLLSWLGPAVAVYVDDDDFWDDLSAAPDMKEYFLKNIARLPLALHAEVESGLALTAFLASARAFIEQTAPDMTVWETRRHRDQAYVRIGPSAQAASDFGSDEFDDVALYYAASGQGFVLSLSETLIQRALERQLARREAADSAADPADAEPATEPRAGAAAEGEPVAPPAWLGESVALSIDRRMIDLFELDRQRQPANRLARLSWSNLPILNEWQRLFPDEDPVATHERLWQRRLLCPGEGTYRWNEADQTMESTMYGHPGRPRLGPVLPAAVHDIEAARFGLSFEDDGLRARAVLEHSPR